MRPKKVFSSNDELVIEWDEKQSSKIHFKKLRDFCPCATCLAERDKQSKDSLRIYNKSQLEIRDIKNIGNYAISITWKDGHSTGIYEYSFLKKLSQD